MSNTGSAGPQPSTTSATFGSTLTTGVVAGLNRGKFYEAQVRAKNADGDGEWSETVETRVNPNRAPEFGSDLPDKVNVPEGPAAGESLGDPYTAADPDGDTVTYTLAGEDAGVLSIGRTTGQIAVGVGYSIDFENPADGNTDNVYIIEVVADDGHGLIVRVDLEITVTDIDEPGSVALSITEPPSRFADLTATLTDPDSQPSTVTWQWQRGDAPS